MSLEERLMYINSVQDFVKASSSKIESIFSLLGWKASEFNHPDVQNTQCPFDRGHWMPPEKLADHIETCTLKKEGYHESDILLPPSSGNEKHAIKIDLETRKKVLSAAFSANPQLKLVVATHPLISLAWKVVERYEIRETRPSLKSPNIIYRRVENILEDVRPVPKTVDRCISDFTFDEQRVLYDFAVSQTAKPSTERNAQDIQLFESIGRSSAQPAKTTKTLEEMMIEMRDAKRRRASYKGKKVKGKSRSYTETLKNLIETQMDVLNEMEGRDPSNDGSLHSGQKELTEDPSFDDSVVVDRPRQLYEKIYMTSDRWSDLGDWVPKQERRGHDDYRSSGEMYKYKNRSYHVKEEFDRHKRTEKGYREEDKDRSYRRKRSRSPDARYESRGESHSHNSSYSREKLSLRDEKEKSSSHAKYFDQPNSSSHEEGFEEKNSKEEEKSKRHHRSRSRSHSRSKHKKHKKQKHKKHSKEREEKRARYESSGGESERQNDRSSDDSSIESKQHSSHKKKKKKKKKEKK